MVNAIFECFLFYVIREFVGYNFSYAALWHKSFEVSIVYCVPFTESFKMQWISVLYSIEYQFVSLYSKASEKDRFTIITAISLKD